MHKILIAAWLAVWSLCACTIFTTNGKRVDPGIACSSVTQNIQGILSKEGASNPTLIAQARSACPTWGQDARACVLEADTLLQLANCPTIKLDLQ